MSGSANTGRTIETAGPELARIIMGWDGPMWRYRNPWGPWTQGEPPSVTGGEES